MRRRLLVCALAWLVPAVASATPITYTTILNGTNEFPANASGGTGTATVVIDTDLHTLMVSASFSDLSGNTTAAHIHCCVSPSAPTPTAGVATQTPSFVGFPLGVTSGNYSSTFDLTQAASWNAAYITNNGGTPAGAEAALAQGLADGFAYFNVHTNLFPGGEIRGFFVPEPSTALMLAAGLGALARHRRAH